MNAQRVLSIAQKEIYHVLRDPFTLGLALLLPVFMVSIFGLAMEFNIKNVPIAVYDGDRSASSRSFIESLGSSDYFLVDPVLSQAEGLQRVDGEKDRAALIIEPEFQYHLLSGRGARAQVLLDGSDSSATGTVIGYLEGMRVQAQRKLLHMVPHPPIEVVTRYLYNPELNSRWFSVPGLIGMVLGLLSILLTALTVAREWESGSMELLLSTPVRPIEIIIGKLAPYVGLGLGAVFIVYAVARLFMGVPFRGSHLIFILACLLFLSTYLALGLLISVIVRKQQASMQFAMLAGLMPTMLLSGFIFPIESMPLPFRILTVALPARWFIEIMRDVFLKGSGLLALRTPFLAMFLIASVIIVAAAKKFKTDVEP